MTSLRIATLCLASAALAAGCTSAVLGAECLPGYEVCDGVCVNVDMDSMHCGACGVACAVGDECRAGRCMPPLFDGGAPSDGEVGFADGDVGPDGSAPDAGLRDAGQTDAGPTGCDVGQRDCMGRCVRTDIDENHCGGCGVRCGAEQVCDDGECRDGCRAPRLVCGGGCVDPGDDPDHCGGCDQPCTSGICTGGSCSGPLAGHLVLVGHDYEDSRADMRRVAGNAVHLGARAGHTRVLVYEGQATAAGIAGVDSAIDQVASETARTWSRVTGDANDVPAQLADADTFVVYAQRRASDLDVEELGVMWGTALGTFLRRGGVVVVFDGMGDNQGTYTMLVRAGLLRMSGRFDVTSRVLDVVSPGDAVALGVPLRYRAEASSVRFETEEGETVVAAADGPVVIHRIVVP